jgi:hypothetical protein
MLKVALQVADECEGPVGFRYLRKNGPSRNRCLRGTE